MPSIQAEANPRRPTRCRQRTRGAIRAILHTSVAVPSGESSSTKMTAHPVAPKVASRRHSNSRTLRDSLRVGTDHGQVERQYVHDSVFRLPIV